MVAGEAPHRSGGSSPGCSPGPRPGMKAQRGLQVENDLSAPLPLSSSSSWPLAHGCSQAGLDLSPGRAAAGFAPCAASCPAASLLPCPSARVSCRFHPPCPVVSPRGLAHPLSAQSPLPPSLRSARRPAPAFSDSPALFARPSPGRRHLSR